MEGYGGTYALVLSLEEATTCQVGKLGLCHFPTGYYIYVGSALGGLAQRLRRHLRIEKRLHWHIDYLLQHSKAIEIWYALERNSHECLWGWLAGNLPGAQMPVPGFGSSDCRCPSHLTHFPSPPPFGLFEQKLKERGACHYQNRVR